MSHQEHALWWRRSQNGAMRYLSVVVVMLMAVMPGQHDWPDADDASNQKAIDVAIRWR